MPKKVTFIFDISVRTYCSSKVISEDKQSKQKYFHTKSKMKDEGSVVIMNIIMNVVIIFNYGM